MKHKANRLVAMLLCMAMLICAMPFSALAAVEYDASATSDYYKVISQKDWELAPGITESEIVLNNDASDRRQVLHVVEVDMENPYTKVIPSIKGMVPTAGNYGVQTMDQQAAYAEANGYGNVVAAMNISLSWYDSTYYDEHPELVGEPLGYMILDGVQYTNSQGKNVGAQTCLVINFDEKDGVARPADIPKTQIRSTSDAITGWEEQVIPANFGFLVKDGALVTTTEEHTSDGAPRSMLGIKADGTIVAVMNDGRQAPYSTGLNSYEMGQIMLGLGCVYAINGDGGGSSQFLSQRPGEELEMHCSPSDGSARATTHGVLIITTAPSDGEFVRASIETDSAYYTPNSTVEFKATGADLGGGAAEIPADVTWQIKESGMGTITDGVFVSNGTAGTVTAQMVYEGNVVGEHSVNIVVPDYIGFESSAYTVPCGKSADLTVNAKYGVYDVTLNANDYTITLDKTGLGSLEGLTYTAGDVEGTITATVTLTHNNAVSGNATINIGKGSEVIFSFEEGTLGTDLSLWQIKDHEGKYTTWSDISLVTAETGMVHNGEQALAMHMPVYTRLHGAEGYSGNSLTWMGDAILLENATAIGMWIYIPEEATQTEIALNYVWYNDSGVAQRVTPDLCLNDTFNGIEKSGWYYLSVPVSKDVAYIKDEPALVTTQGYKRNFFLKFYVTNSGNTGDESSYMGDITYYIDDITVDYSSTVEDRIAPVFSGTYVQKANSETPVAMTSGTTLGVSGDAFNFLADASDNNSIRAASCKIYVDGKAVSANYVGGRLVSDDVTLAAGVHRVVFEVCDVNGNVGYAVRYIEVEGSTPAIQVIPHDPEATVALTSSLYYVDVVAASAENVKTVTLKLDLDTMHTWELAHADLAEGFTASYYFATPADKDDNMITLVLTNNGSEATGNTVLASLPARVWSYSGCESGAVYTAAEAWTAGYIPAVSVNVEVEQGEVIFADNSAETFSAEKIHVDTEAYIHNYKMPADYKSANTYHVHTAEAMEDKAATCTENGYTGRTFCAVCNSVVEWGTTAPATGHDWQVNTEGKLACANNAEEFFNGVYTDGKTYVDGAVIADGWNADNTAYYVDGVKLTGHHVMDGIMYTFGEDGVYDADYQYNGLFSINDTVMYFVNNESQTGYQWIDGTGYYNFDENGYAFNGIVEINGTECLFEKGISVKTDEVLLAGICGEGVYYVIYADGRMVICGSGAMMDFTGLNHNPWWRQEFRFNIKSIFIGKDITRIGMRAFIDTYATEVIFEEGSKLTEIFTHGFSLMDGLTEITIPDGVTTLGVQAFYECPNLKDVYLPVSVTTIIGNTFAESPNVLIHAAKGSPIIAKLESLGLNYVTYDVALGSGSCGEATTWTLSSDGILKISGSGAMTDYAAAEAPWYAFRDGITAVEIGADVTTIGKFSFFNCLKLKSVSFAEDGALETIGWGAFGYTGLESVTIPATVKTLNDYAFYNCVSLKTVAVEDGSVMGSIGRYAFWNDTALQSVFIPDGVTKIGTGAFENTGSVKLSVAEESFAHTFAANNNIAYEVREAVPVEKYSGSCGESTTWGLWSNGVLKISGTGAMTEYAAATAPWYAYRNEITAVEIGADVTTVGKFSFFNCLKLKSVSFAEDGALETIGWGAFGYTGLESVTIPATVKTLNDYAFYNCASLKTVAFAENSNLMTIGRYAFWNTTSLVEVSGMPAGVKLGTCAFLDSNYKPA